MKAIVDAPADIAEPLADAEAVLPESFPLRLVIASVAISIALRARFLTTPLSADEGGYLAVARAWASGKTLYSQAWVDRPQGLLLLFRIWDDLTGGSPMAIRVMAILFGCLAVAAVAYAVFTIAGPRAAAAASLFVAVASANARIEGFIANGELLAGALAAAGVAAACAYLFRGRGVSWLFVSGVLAGCAMSLKQSGFDGFMAIVICILAGGLTGEARWRQVARESAICIAGLASVLGLLAVDGAILGFRAWWYAVAGYRLNGLNASDADWHRFGITGRIAAPTLLPLIGAALIGVAIWLARNRRISRSTVLIPAWLCFAALAFLTGGLFHRHYWVTLTFPLAAAAGVAIAKIKPSLAMLLVCLAIIPSLISSASVIVLDRADVPIAADDDPRPVVDERVGKWYAENRSPDSTLYIMCASAGAYASADAIPPYPYLWLDGVQHGKNAQKMLVDMFAGAHPPTFVAVYQSTLTCNPSGQVDTLVRQRYVTITAVDGAVIMGLRDPSARLLRSGR
jgi:hypothetical protein